MTAFAKQVELTALPAAPEKIFWGCHDSPLGPLLLGVTKEGLCRLEFTSGYGLSYDLDRWAQEWPGTVLVPDGAASAGIAAQLRQMNPLASGHAPLALYGTEFQLKVWRAILQIAPGDTVGYSDIAALIGKPGAAKAVGMAVSANPVQLLIPCHRVANDDNYSKIPPDRLRLLQALEDLAARDRQRAIPAAC